MPARSWPPHASGCKQGKRRWPRWRGGRAVLLPARKPVRRVLGGPRSLPAPLTVYLPLDLHYTAARLALDENSSLQALAEEAWMDLLSLLRARHGGAK